MNRTEAIKRMGSPDQITVHGGDYSYRGWLMSVFPKRPRGEKLDAGRDDQWRAVVQDDNGRLFIHRLDQLEA